MRAAAAAEDLRAPRRQRARRRVRRQLRARRAGAEGEAAVLLRHGRVLAAARELEAGAAARRALFGAAKPAPPACVIA